MSYNLRIHMLAKYGLFIHTKHSMFLTKFTVNGIQFRKNRQISRKVYYECKNCKVRYSHNNYYKIRSYRHEDYILCEPCLQLGRKIQYQQYNLQIRDCYIYDKQDDTIIISESWSGYDIAKYELTPFELKMLTAPVWEYEIDTLLFEYKKTLRYVLFLLNNILVNDISRMIILQMIITRIKLTV